MASLIESQNGLQCDHGRRRHTIVESLLREVFLGRLRAGQHLVTQELAARFGTSHTPIREALIALAGMGVIDLVPNRGAIVRHVGARELREICQVRRALECLAVRNACGRVQPEQLRGLAGELRRLRAISPPLRARCVTQARDVDSRLHDLIAASCGNAFLANELARLKTLFRVFRDVSWEHVGAWNDYERVVEEAGEHLAIVEALLAGDAAQAAAAMSRHIRNGGVYWSRAVAGAGGTARSTPSKSLAPPRRHSP
jgi:DNA-binding GntR family transcriptional regulator